MTVDAAKQWNADFQTKEPDSVFWHVLLERQRVSRDSTRGYEGITLGSHSVIVWWEEEADGGHVREGASAIGDLAGLLAPRQT
ncbi:hypothetical protein GCM10009863_67670 [Streptomyces axinellae]|uniref:Uncharacterized protein n=1 Tax=Streptomyces axinellae TaxID=552788 RepID=A0ABN3R1Y1_9ACTN